MLGENDKFCRKCGKKKLLSEYRPKKHGRKGVSGQCKKCENARDRKKLEENPELKLIKYLRTRIWHFLKENQKSKTTEKLLGLSIEKFKQYLEKQFEGGMSWDNYGEWHVDHIIPCSWYDFSKEHHQEECFYYTNLQPLWAKDNLSKGGV